ncbi:hypothetical protein AB0383_48710 [Amycolatopsis sp. NPDC051373]|uniref:hypothetical protein n=1 Tax=Amycolatopsis sp. NPDC051373 TaxID=3155801 RepID=UPI003450A084
MAVSWFFEHLDDVLSDMSMFHRIDHIDQVPASRFLPLMVRLGLYDGAVLHAVRTEAESAQSDSHAVAPESIAASTEQLAHLNTTALYGPLNGQPRLFDIG